MPRQVTIKEVAAAAGVSYQTVSKVLNHQVQVSEETEDRIRKVVETLGYHPNQIARNLRSQRSCMIGFSWAPTPADQANPISDQFTQSIVEFFESAGYHLLAFPFKPGKAWVDGYRDLIESNRVDGFVLSSIDYDDPRIKYLQEQDFPFVAFGRSNPDWVFPYVDVDGAAGMRMVAEHLISQGHYRIALLNWPETSRVGQNRMEGIMEVLNENGIEIRPEWNARSEGFHNFGYQASFRWLDVPANQRPTAIVATNDAMAVGAMNAAQNLGIRIGVDLAITGFDDMPMVQYLTPGLTTVRQPIWELGQIAAEILLGILNGNPIQNQHVLLKPTLIIRSSSSQPARSA